MESVELADPTRGDNHGRVPNFLGEKIPRGPVAARERPLVHFLYSAISGAEPRRSAVFPGAQRHSAVPTESVALREHNQQDNRGRNPGWRAENGREATKYWPELICPAAGILYPTAAGESSNRSNSKRS